MQCSTDALAALRSGTAASANFVAGQPPYGGPWSLPAGQVYGCPDDCIGDFLYGIIKIGVAAGATETITVQPQKKNQPRRLYLSQTVADGFLIDDIKVGVDSLLATPSAIDPSIFIPNGIAPNFIRKVCDVSQFVSVQVQNLNAAAAANFKATMSAYWLL
jgi:hypothetical protein